MADNSLLTPAQAQEKLQVGKTMLYQLLSDGEIESVKIGRARRIPTQSVDAYIKRLVEQAGAHDDQ